MKYERRPGGSTTQAATAPVSEAEPTVPLTVPDLDPDAGPLTAALAYAKAGWYVLPVQRASKKPGSIVGNDWQHKSSRDPQQIAAWFAGTDCGIALHCGRSGAVVCDVDYPSKLPDVLAAHLGCAPYQSTRPDNLGRGHYVFLQPPGRTLGNGTGRLGGAWGEVRGANGVIIVAPSRHANGGEYRWVRIGLVPVLPEDIAELLDDASPAEDAATDEQVAAFVAKHTNASRPEVIQGWCKTLREKFETSSRHNSAVSVTVGALKEARAGLLSAQTIIDTLEPMFITAATRPSTGGERQRTESEARDEYKGIVAWGVAQANEADLDEVRKRTAEKMPDNVEFVDHIGDQRPDGSAEQDVTHSAHLGMAVKMGKLFKGNLLYVNNIGWHSWDGKRWAPDSNGADRRAVHAVIKREARRAFRAEQLAAHVAEVVADVSLTDEQRARIAALLLAGDHR